MVVEGGINEDRVIIGKIIIPKDKNKDLSWLLCNLIPLTRMIDCGLKDHVSIHVPRCALLIFSFFDHCLYWS